MLGSPPRPLPTLFADWFSRLRPWPLLVILLALAAIGPTACDSEDEPAPANQPTRDADTGALTTGGELRIAQREPITLDPALVVDPFSATYIVELFGGLVGLDPDLHVVPDLAEQIPEPRLNQDGTVTYRFVLRENAIFHDGRRVTAADVKWSLERALAPATLSPTAASFLGDIRGAREYALGQTDEISGLEVIDDHTIDITTSGPVAAFVAKLTFPVAFVVDRNEIEADPAGWARQPNGTGPFRLQEWRQGDQIVLQRFEGYHLEPAHVDTVRVRFVPAGVTQYEVGEFDIVAVEPGALEQLLDPDSPVQSEFVTTTSLFWLWVGFNTNEPPFDDALVRKAMAMAIDKQALAEALQGSMAVAEGFLAPGIAGYEPNFRGLAFDPDTARKILSDSRYADSPVLTTIRLTVPAGGTTPETAVDAIIEMWRQNLGITVEVDALDPATFASTLGERRFQAFVATSGPGFPDPSEVLEPYFYSQSMRNFTSYSNPTVNSLLERARAEFNLNERIRLYQEAHRMIVDDAPGVPLLHPQINQLAKPYVHGYEPPQIFVPYLRYISLEQ